MPCYRDFKLVLFWLLIFFVPQNFIFITQFLNDNEKNYIVPILGDFYSPVFSRWNKIRKTVFC